MEKVPPLDAPMDKSEAAKEIGTFLGVTALWLGPLAPIAWGGLLACFAIDQARWFIFDRKQD